MADLQAAIDEANAGILQLAAALELVDVDQWTNQREAALERLRNALVRTDYAGTLHKDSSGARFGLGASPIVALALLVSINALVAPIVEGMFKAVPADEGDLASWKERVETYAAEIAAARAATGDAEPSERVWKMVTLPLLNGWLYGPGAGQKLEFQTKVPPTIVRPLSLVRNSIWYAANVFKLQEWLSYVDTWTVNAKTAVLGAGNIVGEWVKEHVAPIIEPAVQAAKWLPWLLVGGAGLGIAVWLGRR